MNRRSMNPLQAGVALLLLLAFVASGCDAASSDAVSSDARSENARGNAPGTPQARGAVYVMTNAADNNEVVVFSRAVNGRLTRVGAVSTGGQGSGTPPVRDPLGSQDALILSADRGLLFAVNAGSNEVSSFRVSGDGLSLTLVGTAPSGGMRPVSLTQHGALLYVLNAGGRGNISGLTVAADGALTPLAGSTQPLSGTDTPLPGNTVAPASIRFSPDGGLLAVTEKATSLIDTYVVGSDGRPGAPTVQRSVGRTPFGADFDSRGTYIVSETNATAPRTPVPDGGSVSSYRLAASTGVLSVVSGEVPTEETAPCWIQITPDERYVYTTNTASGTLTGFRLGADGSLVSLDPRDGITGSTGAGSVPLGMAVSGDFLYVLTAGQGEVAVFRIRNQGGLTALRNFGAGGLPGETVSGIAAF